MIIYLEAVTEINHIWVVQWKHILYSIWILLIYFNFITHHKTNKKMIDNHLFNKAAED